VLASGYVLDDTPRSRAAVLSRWSIGHEVFQWGRGFVWLLPEPERVHCDGAPGLPLISVERRLCSAPFAPDELDGLPPGITLAEGGQVVSRSLGPAVDVSAWLDVSRFTLAEGVEPLGDPPAPPELEHAPRPAVGARAALGLQPLSSEAAAVAESLRTGQPLPQAPKGPPPITIGPLARSVMSGLRVLSRWLSRLLAPAPTRGAAPQRSSALAPPRPQWLSRFHAWLDRVLDASRLAQILGQRQADYLSRLMQMFEQGDLDAALRHAIPLGGQAQPGETSRSLALPSPRTSLAISRGRPGSGPTMLLRDDYYAELRRRYRAAAEKLEREGRYREAAFVLAELLHADEEAIALLERHGLYPLAAELAESRQLAPGLQVRQWFLAKDLGRAVAVARRHGVFADAVSRLERSKHLAEARQLRLLWADALATNGDFFTAVSTLWPLEGYRPLTRRWVELGVAQGGTAGARLEVMRLVLDGERADPGPLAQALGVADPERAAERAAITLELQLSGVALPPAATKTRARAAVRGMLRDAAGAPPPALLSLAADGALKADLPPPRMPEVRLALRAPPMRIDVEAHDRGALAVHDAALLADGRTLVALGEAGVRLLTRDGRTATHFEVPAQSLVPYNLGGRALCLIRRGEAVAMARLDVLAGKVEPLPPLNLASWADGTDGSMWFAYDGQSLCGLDLHDAQLRALWRVAVPVPCAPVSRAGPSLSVVTQAAPGELEWWRWELPSLTLRARQLLSLPQVYERLAVAADGMMCQTQGGIAWEQQHAAGPRVQLTGVAGGVIVAVGAVRGWFSLVARSEGGQRWMLADSGAATVRHVVQLPRAQFSVRLSPTAAVYTDADGRVLAVDLDSGRRIRDFRVR
jgi:hypothetical protein